MGIEGVVSALPPTPVPLCTPAFETFFESGINRFMQSASADAARRRRCCCCFCCPGMLIHYSKSSGRLTGRRLIPLVYFAARCIAELIHAAGPFVSGRSEYIHAAFIAEMALCILRSSERSVTYFHPLPTYPRVVVRRGCDRYTRSIKRRAEPGDIR